MSDFKPRCYQDAALAAITDRFAEGYRAALAVLATGAGKTVIFAHLVERMIPHGRVMVLAHREELIRQAARKIRAVTNIVPAIEKAQESVDEESMHGKPPIVVASIPTMNGSWRGRKRMEKFDPMEFALLVTDECFPAGTRVDGVPIETLRPGDMVRSVNHATGRIERRRVVRLYRSVPKAIVRVTLTDGRAITCTPGHPFYVGGAYVPAASLIEGDVLTTVGHEAQSSSTGLQGMRRSVHRDVCAGDVLEGMRDAPTVEAAPSLRRAAVSSMRQAGGGERQAWSGGGATGSGLLLAGMPGGVGVGQQFAHDGADEQPLCRRADAIEEPDAAGRRSGEGVGNTEGNGLGADSACGERVRHDGPRTHVCRGDRLEAGDGDDARTSAGSHWHSESLQDRRWQLGLEGCGGDRRQLASCRGAQAAGPQERCVFGIARVAGVSVLQPADRDELERVCPSGVVYNVEVEGNHNYFAEGVLVHNCHHSFAGTWQAVIRHFMDGNPNLKVLGVTATPDRADGENIGGIFDCVAYSYDLPDAIRDGYLVKPHQRYVTIEGLDFSKVGTRAGDLAQDDLEAVMIAEKPLHGVVHAAIEVACGLGQGALAKVKDRADRAEVLARMLVGKPRMKTLVFAVSVAHAERMAEIFNRWLPGSAAHVSGATKPLDRAHVLRDFSRGKYQFLTNCQLATEGYDEPGIECIVMARPTKSRPLYTQCVGRGTRPDDATAGKLAAGESADDRRAMIAASGKPCCTVLDFVGNAGKHKLVSSFDLCAPPDVDPAVLERAKELAQADGDVAAALAEAEEEIEEERAVERVRVEMNEEQAAEIEAARESDRQRESAKRLGLVGTTTYTMRDVDGFDRHATVPTRETPLQRGGASDKQVDLLVGLGVQRKTAAGYGSRQASAVIESLKAKRCTERQAYALKRRGYSDSDVAVMNFNAASAALDAAKRAEGAAA